MQTQNTTLGCGFKGDEYLYPRLKSWIAEVHIWGREDAVLPMEFSSEQRLLEFLEDLTSLCASVMGRHRYDDIDQLIRFLSEFKKGQSLALFYENYNYKIRPSEVSPELTFIRKLKELATEKYPNYDVGRHFYLIPAYLENLSIQDDLEDPLKPKKINPGYHHDHVAGAFKIQLPNDRIGFIIIDLNIGLNVPIILMEDEKPPHLVTTKSYTFHWTFVSQFDSVDMLVKGNLYDIRNRRKITSTLLYSVRRPYCDFAEGIFKPNLIAPVHGMLRRDSSGAKRAQLSFKIPDSIKGSDDTSEKMDESNFKFKVVTYAGGKVTTEDTILFQDLLEDSMTDENGRLGQVASALGLTPEHLWCKMVAIKLLLFDCHCKKLLKQFAQIRNIQSRKRTQPLVPKGSVEDSAENPEALEILTKYINQRSLDHHHHHHHHHDADDDGGDDDDEDDEDDSEDANDEDGEDGPLQVFSVARLSLNDRGYRTHLTNLPEHISTKDD